MEDRNDQLLINYLDRTLEEKEMREMEALINSDDETRKQFRFLQLAVDAVEYSAIYDQVASVKENFREIQPVEVLQTSNKKAAPVFRLSKTVRMAAAVLLLLVGVGSYKFFTVNATRVYEQAFIAYTLPTTRGQATITDIEQVYFLTAVMNGNFYKNIIGAGLGVFSKNIEIFIGQYQKRWIEPVW